MRATKPLFKTTMGGKKGLKGKKTVCYGGGEPIPIHLRGGEWLKSVFVDGTKKAGQRGPEGKIEVNFSKSEGRKTCHEQKGDILPAKPVTDLGRN